MLLREYIRAILQERHMRRLFHGTSSEFLDSIKQQGLRGDPGHRLFEDDVQRPMEDHIYLTTNPGIAHGYAGRASSKFGGESMILVFHMKPDDPRFVSDEDWAAHIRGYLVESGMPYYEGNASDDLGRLWALANGETDQYDVLKVPYASLEHVKILMDTKSALRYSRRLADVIETVRNAANGQFSDFAGMADEMSEEELKKHADRLTTEVRKATEDLLRKSAPHPWTPVERILLFVLDSELHTWVMNPGRFGKTKREAWQKMQEQFVRDWPEWFGPEAALVGASGGTVAIEADNLMPSEMWVIDRPGRIDTYEDVMRRGRQS